MFIYSRIMCKTRKHQNRLYLNFWRAVYVNKEIVLKVFFNGFLFMHNYLGLNMNITTIFLSSLMLFLSATTSASLIGLLHVDKEIYCTCNWLSISRNRSACKRDKYEAEVMADKDEIS